MERTIKTQTSSSDGALWVGLNPVWRHQEDGQACANAFAAEAKTEQAQAPRVWGAPPYWVADAGSEG